MVRVVMPWSVPEGRLSVLTFATAQIEIGQGWIRPRDVIRH